MPRELETIYVEEKQDASPGKYPVTDPFTTGPWEDERETPVASINS
jgi:hypothetical protein